ncbi:peptidase M16 [Idiomarina sp. MD25a]|uniref:insulinase family protein n=2 Tax=Idiomarina TaxID=135575 RepID=UPI0008F86D14|nr:insulinase family protein [Idiomarina sp. MD25a]OIN03317.1 peptidase M16 [Idiomarina sp. MD25a]
MKNLFMLSALTSALILAGCSSSETQSNNAQVAAQSQQALAEQVVKSPNDERQYRVVTLPNQLEVMLISDPNTEKSAAALSVGVGLLKDPMTQQGMAHYLEHMLFLGTDKYPDTNGYSEFMSNNGGSQNASTWLDITNYMFKVNNSAYDEALDRFSDFFKSPKLYAEYADKEKNAVNAEWSMRREMDFFGQFKLARMLLGEHPANRFLIGNNDSLGDKENSKLHEELVNFYNRYYSANIMKVAMISNESLDKMESLAKKHFASIENDDIEPPETTDKVDFAKAGKKRIHYVPNEDVKQLRLEFIIDDNQDQFAVKPNRFVTYLLGSEMPGTPTERLKAMGLISSLNASASPTEYGNYGALTVDINLTDAGMKHREDITALVMQYINMIKEQGVDKKYFKEIQTSLANSFRFLEKGDEFGYVASLASAMQNYPAQYVISAPYEYKEFDAEAINNVLNQLTPEHLRVWYISKDEPHDKELSFYDGKYQVEDIAASEIATWSTEPQLAINLPKVNTLLPENFDLKKNADFDQPKVVIEEPGIEVWQYPSQVFADQPRGVLTTIINNPDPITDVKKSVLLALWQDLYNLRVSALSTEASIAGMSLNLNDNRGLTFNISGFTDKQPELMQRALEELTFDIEPQAFAQAVDRLVRGIKNKGQQFPLYQSFDAYGQIIREGQFADDSLIQAAQNVKPADLASYMDELLANNSIKMFAFGNYDKADLQLAVNEIKDVLPADRRITEFRTARFWKPQSDTSLVLRKDLSVADVGIVDAHINGAPSFATQAAATVLQGHFRTEAFDTLRTEEQLAYAVGTFAPQLDRYTGFGLYIQTPVKNVADMQARFESFKKEYWETLQNLKPETFEQLKSSTLVTLNEPPKNLSEELQPVLSDWYLHRYDFDTKQQLINAVEQVTLEDAKQFYKDTVLNEDSARISVQLRGEKFQDASFADLPNQQVIEDLAEFHQEMPKQ